MISIGSFRLDWGRVGRGIGFGSEIDIGDADGPAASQLMRFRHLSSFLTLPCRR